MSLTWLAYRQLQYESFYQHQALAESLVSQVDARVTTLFATEDQRSFVEFSYLMVGEGQYVQRSPLSQYPVNSAVPGLIAYFQVDATGGFSTPLLPVTQISEGVEDRPERTALEMQIRALLSEPVAKRLDETVSAPASVAPAPSFAQGGLKAKKDDTFADADQMQTDEPIDSATRLFDNLDQNERQMPMPTDAARLNLKETYEVEQIAAEGKTATAQKLEKRARRTERNYEPESAGSAEVSAAPFGSFRSEVDPFQAQALGSDHLVILRNVWREQQRLIQGAVLTKKDLYQELIQQPFMDSAIASMSDLSITFPDTDITHIVSSMHSGERPGADIGDTLLYRRTLSAPFNNMELVFSFSRLPLGSGGALILLTGGVLLALMLGGFILLYRTGVRQIALAEQQQDFVSAISHELKTPLTSIRMYGEILKSGWATDEKKQEYYRFIFDESERLTRLINNVLHLARINRNGNELTIRSTSVGELTDLARSKVASTLEAAGFTLEERHTDPELQVQLDSDAFIQIVINLIDNAIKFSAHAQTRCVQFNSRRVDGSVAFSVRDFGPGVPPDQMRKIFKLFYRSEQELTRETVGTGIGLALVADLAAAMGGSVDVVNANPGAEFRVRLPVSTIEA